MADLTPLLQELQSALVSGDEAEARRAALALAARAVEDIPALHAALNMLGYHGRLDLANEVMAEAWPRLKEDEGYSRPAVTAFMSRATDHLIYHYLESTPPAGLDADLVEALERYFEVDAGRLELYLAFLRGESGRRWQPADFATQLSFVGCWSSLLDWRTGQASRIVGTFARRTAALFAGSPGGLSLPARGRGGSPARRRRPPRRAGAAGPLSRPLNAAQLRQKLVQTSAPALCRRAGQLMPLAALSSAARPIGSRLRGYHRSGQAGG